MVTKNYINRQSIVLFLLGFSSGLPLVLIVSTLQAWYTSAGVSLMTIGVLSLLGQPYIYKFLWAPILDRYIPLVALGRRRSWISLMQMMIFIVLVLLAFQNPANHPWRVAIIAFFIAIFSASQDMAIDAYRTDLLSEKERGWGAAVYNIGYRGAMLVGGALALILANYVGWRATYLFMSSLILLEIFVTLWFAPELREKQAPLMSLKQAVIQPAWEFLRRQYRVTLILFLISYKLCDAFALTLNTTFLLRGIGFSLAELGVISKTMGLTAAILGSILGGVFLRQWGLYRSLLYFGILQIMAAFPFVILAWVGKNYWLMSSAVFFEYFIGSLSSVSLIVLLMDLCDRRYTATQFALFSALVSMGRVFVGPVAALMVEQFGWVWYYLLTGFLGLPSIIILLWLKGHLNLFADKELEHSPPIELCNN